MWWQLKVKASAECEDYDDDAFPAQSSMTEWGPIRVQQLSSGGGKLPQSFSFSFSLIFLPYIHPLSLLTIFYPLQFSALNTFKWEKLGLAQAHKVAGGRTVVVPQKFLLGKLGMCVLSDDSRLERARE